MVDEWHEVDLHRQFEDGAREHGYGLELLCVSEGQEKFDINFGAMVVERHESLKSARLELAGHSVVDIGMV